MKTDLGRNGEAFRSVATVVPVVPRLGIASALLEPTTLKLLRIKESRKSIRQLLQSGTNLSSVRH